MGTNTFHLLMENRNGLCAAIVSPKCHPHVVQLKASRKAHIPRRAKNVHGDCQMKYPVIRSVRSLGWIDFNILL
jgi:hypothetical protein